MNAAHGTAAAPADTVSPADTAAPATTGAPADTAARADIERLLALTHRHLGMEAAWLSTFTGGRQVIVAASGSTTAIDAIVGTGTDLAGAYSTRILTGALPPVVTDARRHLVTRDLSATRDLGIGAYVGVPWQGPDGSPAGMLCCASRTPDPNLDADAARFLTFIADVFAENFAGGLAERHPDAHHAATTIDAILRAGAMHPVFQPVVRLSDGVAVAFEALARFAPDMFITPDKAFAAAASCGRGVELELLALRHALRHLPDLPQAAWLGLNLSPEALLNPTVQDTVLAHADQRIGVELTEHAAVKDYRRLTEVTERLRAAGVQIVVDDAGAGYAGLHHILQLRPDTIKLDIALVRDIDTDPVKSALARSLVMFAADIGASLVAEGIETEAERTTLRRLGVGYGQGYLLARPAPLP